MDARLYLPFLNKLYFKNEPIPVKTTSLDDLIKSIADSVQTYLGEFKNGALYLGIDEPISTSELTDILGMEDSDVEDYMQGLSILKVNSNILYNGLYIKPENDWARGGIKNILQSILNKDIEDFWFPIDIKFSPDMFTCQIKVRLFYKDLEKNDLRIQFIKQELGANEKLSCVCKEKKYSGYYASPDGSMNAELVINKFRLNWNLGNVCKYIIRAGKKDPNKHIEDLEKAKKYIEFEIERLQSENL